MVDSQGIFQDIADYIRVSKEGLNLARSAWALLPKSANRDEAERKLLAAEHALKRTDAALAQKLGYELCQCTFPPQIMLWREKEGAHICQNVDCGRTIKNLERRLLDGGGIP
jgi:hypothetical protein